MLRSLRHSLVVPVVLVVIAATGLAVWGNAYASRRFMAEASLQAGTALRLAVAALSGHLRRYEALPALIADHDDIRRLISSPGDQTLRDSANHYLKEINGLLRSSDIYVMTRDGETIAASNYDRATSFVGENFSYRPYFRQAAEGKRSRFYARGTTSFKRGYFFAAPIDIDGRVAGVIVFKVDIDMIEASWRGGEYEIFVSDPEGVIFMTSNPEWLYASILALTPERLRRTEASRRYAEADLKDLGVVRSRIGDHTLMSIPTRGATRDYLVLSEYVSDADWTVRVLMDMSWVRSQTHVAVAAVFLFLCLAGLSLAVLLQRHARRNERMQMQIEAKAELERRVEERTADLADLNAQLRSTQADLVQAGKLAGLGQMSAALSHEFNQPLAAAKTYADSASLLIERNRIDEAKDNLRRISNLIDRMASISRHLRNFARKPNEKLGPVALDDVLRDTLEIVSARLVSADAELVVALGEPAPLVRAGSVRLQQVLVNIISNAADAVEGLEDRRITVTATTTGDRVAITVRDAGAGIPKAIAERIFDPFFTTKGVGKGLGLGLSISYNIVKDFGGRLSVENHPEGGAMFRIELDRMDSRREAAE
ncbi:two-component system C4-dicarboxylate transport sensor histidine kinase DctB [Rhizobium sp. PP-F2F-G38]|nr:two-component system C4-dicarboxylate transport sensor histidine kinase DctB [Rhizobium sp. PP-WC-1G-195]PYE99286.1 two-component system C4-dicarboxylate transport sensor histidine kinase DctB [Rhizobium sp. PP-F2F-G38]